MHLIDAQKCIGWIEIELWLDCGWIVIELRLDWGWIEVELGYGLQLTQNTILGRAAYRNATCAN